MERIRTADWWPQLCCVVTLMVAIGFCGVEGCVCSDEVEAPFGVFIIYSIFEVFRGFVFQRFQVFGPPQGFVSCDACHFLSHQSKGQ